MNPPLNILAAALGQVQLRPLVCSLPPHAQAELAAMLVIAQTADVAVGAFHQGSNALMPYINEVEVAKERLSHTIEELAKNEKPAKKAGLIAEFEGAQDVYYQATASLAELVARMVLPERVRKPSIDSVWAQGYF